MHFVKRVVFSQPVVSQFFIATIKFYEEVKNIRRRQYLDCARRRAISLHNVSKGVVNLGPKSLEPDVPQRRARTLLGRKFA